MRPSILHFLSLFATLLAIINPLEAIPVFLKLLRGKSDPVHRAVARNSCIYATLLMFFFLAFGTLLLKVFGVPLSMVRVVGGIILTRIGFDLFAPSSTPGMIPSGGSEQADGQDVAFVPLALPIMFGPGGIATLISMAATLHVNWTDQSLETVFASCAAIVMTMVVTFFSLAYSSKILGKIGPRGIDAATRITGFFVSAIGMGLIFQGVIEFLQSYGIIGGRIAG
ncbi:MAG: MarC family protein [Rhodanobacteraceae bacterium]